MHSFEFQVVLNSPLETVFAVYVDTEQWTNRNQLGDIDGSAVSLGPREAACAWKPSLRFPFRWTR